jgi:hypothetical protein
VTSASRHLGPALRALWVLVLALAFVWQPVLLAAGAAHGSAHALADEHPHGHAHSHGDHDHHGGDEPAAPHDDNPWHGLMHVVQCCGALCVLPVEAPVLALAALPSTAPPRTQLTTASPVLPHPLRPPIAA